MKDMMIVQTYGLTKKYGNMTALSDAYLEIPKGAVYGLVGNNGAGKTTFLKLLTGEIVPTAGRFQMLGAETEAEFCKVRRRIGAIIEGPAFYPNMTAFQNLEYYRIQRGIPGKELVMRTLELVGLADAKRKKFKNMSMGMKQRLGLGLALLGEPELLILDEPINGLDPSGIMEIRNLLLKLNRDKQITIIISSHILTELQNIATEYGFLNNGRVIEQISAEDLKKKCQSYLEIKVTQPEKYASLLESRLACTNYKVMPDGGIQIFDAGEQPEAYSALAVNNGIGLLSFERKEVNLENYYMGLVEAETGKGAL